MMKTAFIFILLMCVTFISQANNIAIDAVKSEPKIIDFLADKSPEEYQVTFEQVELGGVCGFVGCSWRKLVSLVVISKNSNKPSSTILVLVEGVIPATSIEPTVSFVSVIKEDNNNLIFTD